MESGIASFRRLLSALMFCIGVIFLAACNKAEKEPAKAKNLPESSFLKDKEDLPANDPGKTEKEAMPIEEINEMTYTEREVADSLEAMAILEEALKVARGNRKQGDFKVVSDSVEMEYGNILSRARKHLLVRVLLPGTIRHHVFLPEKNTFKEVLAIGIEPMVFIEDSLFDVNGDGRKDLLIHWYPASGCCLRDIYDVYLQRPNGGFASQKEFINPSFSPKEKVIRGMCYGHAAPLYKYRWNGYEVDTVEFIHSPDTIGGAYLRNKSLDESTRGTVLKDIPIEYKKIGYGKE